MPISHFYIFKVGLAIWMILMEDHLQNGYFCGMLNESSDAAWLQL